MPNQNRTNKARTFAIGDIHGHHQQLVNLINAIAPIKDDSLIFLGDYVDRGPDSKAVIDEILALKDICKVIMLKGNHEVMMVEAFTTQHLKNRHILASGWMKYGGVETLASYGMDGMQLLSDDPTDQLGIPDTVRAHLSLLQNLPLYHITDTHIFVHGSPKLNIPIEKQDEEYLLWRKKSKHDAEFNYEHESGKTIICGHTAQYDGMPNRLSEKNIIIDTGCYKSGWLTAINIDTEQFIQANNDSYRVLE